MVDQHLKLNSICARKFLAQMELKGKTAPSLCLLLSLYLGCLYYGDRYGYEVERATSVKQDERVSVSQQILPKATEEREHVRRACESQNP
jgi:hypothetical protein